MARRPLRTQFFITIFLLLILTPIQSQPFSRKLSRNSFGFKKEKLSHLHFYFHDIITSDHPTAVIVAAAASTNASQSLFGAALVMDDPLTLTPDPGSKVVGRAQGMYASADLKKVAFLMVMNFCFTEGKYNGSTLSILGRNAPLKPVREMPIVGGSGLFRFARGYVQAKPHSLDAKAGNAVVEYDVFVLHY